MTGGNSMDKKECIKKIQNCYHRNELSFIVGAGFSKNISSKYLDWKGLLKDAIWEMYGSDIKKAYNSSYLESDSSITTEEREINNIINQYGYLNIASEYVRRKGFREAIDVYIEKRTPRLLEENDETILEVAGAKEILRPESLSAHKALIDLECKNIYTFNYDNALDYVANTMKNADAREKCEKTITLCEDYIKSIDGEENSCRVTEQDIVFPTNADDGRRKRAEILEQLGAPVELIKNNDELKKRDFVRHEEGIAKNDLCKLRNVYYLIKSDKDIRLCESQKNIWKLHGSIPMKSSEPYGFDGDLNAHYVITTEDYQYYPQRHEAFANYMKIALLKDCFCIIGFSCDDPNFLNWLCWVKTILKDIKKEEIRIFFIDAVNKDISDEKKLLFKNNKIQYLSLVEEDGKKTPAELLKSLFKEIQCFSSLDAFNHFVSEANYAQYFTPQLIDEMWESYDKFIPQYSNKLQQRTTKFIIQKFVKASAIDNHNLKLFVMAVKVNGTPIHTFFDEKELNTLREKCTDPILKNRLELLLMRSAILQNNLNFPLCKKETDAMMYEKIWGTLFSLNFMNAYKLCHEWKPSDNSVWELKKGFLMQHRETVNRVCLNKEVSPFYMNVINSSCYKSSVYISDEFSGDSSFIDWHEIRSSILKELQPKQNSLNSYGIDTIHFWMDGEDTGQEDALKLLQLYIEIGIFSVKNYFFCLKDCDWYKVFKFLYADYPYPCLYFTLQYGNRKVVKRVAQDFIYEEHLHNVVIEATDKLFALLLQSDENIPIYIKEGAATILSQFVKRVKPDVWQKYLPGLYKLANESLKENECINDFIYNAISYSNNDSFKEKVVLDILLKKENITNEDNNHLVNVRPSSEYRLSENTMQALEDICSISEMKFFHFFVLFNMHSFFNQEIRSKFILCLENLDYKKCKQNQLLEAPLSMNLSNDVINSHIKVRILSSEYTLFSTGITEDRIVPEDNGCLNLHLIVTNIDFSLIEKQSLYDKICSVVKEIDLKYCTDSLYRFVIGKNLSNILIQSKLCIQCFGHIANDAENLLQEIEYKLTKLIGYATFEDATLTNDAFIADNLFRILRSYGRYLYPFQENKRAYKLLLSRIISRNPVELESCILFMSNFMSLNKTKVGEESIIEQITIILDIYQRYYDKGNNLKWDLNAQKNRVEQAMLQFYDLMVYWNREHEFWKNYQKIYN